MNRRTKDRSWGSEESGGARREFASRKARNVDGQGLDSPEQILSGDDSQVRGLVKEREGLQKENVAALNQKSGGEGAGPERQSFSRDGVIILRKARQNRHGQNNN